MATLALATAGAVIGGTLFGPALMFAPRIALLTLLLPVWLFIRMALNAIDGMMARELDMKSNLGEVLNEIGDVVSDLALYLPLAYLAPSSAWAVVAFAIGGALTELCGILARATGASRRYDGPMGKSDRALLMGIVGLLAAFLPGTIRFWPYVFGSAAVLTLVTCVKRLSKALAELDQEGGTSG